MTRATAPLCLMLALAVVPAAQVGDHVWVDSLPDGAHPNLRHGTFPSASMGHDVGYVVYLPPGYDAPANARRRYPVVYHLHGGLSGTEIGAIAVADDVHRAIQAGVVPPRIYVFVNGGKYSHYDYGDSLAETAFVHELVPHVDRTYRTIAERSGRALEGFSAGGRGTARIAFKHPGVFGSAIPMAGGHQHEKLVSDGRALESNFGIPLNRTYNSWDLARGYAALEDAPEVQLLVVVGTLDRNYEANLEWMAHLEALGIPFERLIVADTAHNRRQVYQKAGAEILAFHERSFARAGAAGG